MLNTPKICVIGAGPCGLIAVRRIMERNLECFAFEIQNDIGGIWVHNKNVGMDEYGLPIHSSVFDHLRSLASEPWHAVCRTGLIIENIIGNFPPTIRTNVPRDIMMIPGFDFEKGEEDTCFPRHVEVKKYLHDFAEKFKLTSSIKLRHKVELVSKDDDKWKVLVRNIVKQRDETFYFDSIVICTGHYCVPQIPNIKGLESFKKAGGYHVHSHFYRSSNCFKGLRIIVFGLGASGIDIVCELMCVAKKIIASSRSWTPENPSPFPKEVTMKGQIDYLVGKTVHFKDGTTEQIDIILYGTGYQYRLPFLHRNCKITIVDHKFVQPCWKHMINIHEPTMCFLGLIFDTDIFPVVDLQIRVFLNLLLGRAPMPSKMELLESWKTDIKLKEESGAKISYYHAIGDEMLVRYNNELADVGNTERVPTVFMKIYELIHRIIKTDYKNLRKTRFEILDNESFSWSFDFEPKKIYIVD